MSKAASETDEKDPSMEDILQSIKQIIADEGDAPPPAPAPSAAPVGEDVLELTDLIQEDGSVVEVGAGGADVLREIDALSTVDAPKKVEAPVTPAPVVQDVAEVRMTAAADDPRPVGVVSSIVADTDALVAQPVASHTRDIIRDRLLEIPRRNAEPVIPLRDGITVEDLVIETLRPMLKEWLDNNLEHTVEQIVAREIRRLMPND